MFYLNLLKPYVRYSIKPVIAPNFIFHLFEEVDHQNYLSLSDRSMVMVGMGFLNNSSFQICCSNAKQYFRSKFIFFLFQLELVQENRRGSQIERYTEEFFLTTQNTCRLQFIAESSSQLVFVSHSLLLIHELVPYI